jgi:hypothetical protein
LDGSAGLSFFSALVDESELSDDFSDAVSVFDAPSVPDAFASLSDFSDFSGEPDFA